MTKVIQKALYKIAYLYLTTIVFCTYGYTHEGVFHGWQQTLSQSANGAKFYFIFVPLDVKYSQPFCPHRPLDPRQRLGDSPSNLTQRRHLRLARLAGANDGRVDSDDISDARLIVSLDESGGENCCDDADEDSMESIILGEANPLLSLSGDEGSGPESSSSTRTKEVLVSR